MDPKLNLTNPHALQANELKVGLVACCLSGEHLRGMGRYVYELVRQSDELAPVAWTLYGEDPQRSMRLPPGRMVRADSFVFRGDRLHLWEQAGLPQRAVRDSVDVLHCTEGSLPWWQPVPTVVTVHDTLAWEEHPNTLIERFYYHQLQAAALHRCAAVVTISESSRRDIEQRWPRLASKLTVIPHGIADHCFIEDEPGPPPALQGHLGGSRYLVYLGGPMPRKRFDWALRVLADAPDASLRLVACGFGAAARDGAASALQPSLRERVHFAPFLEDAELRRLMRGAVAVLYPTLYEGFGFPVVEAHAAGVPCLFSAVGSLGELVGPLSFVVPTDDLAAWGHALERARALNGEARAALAQEGRRWARQFTWRRSCEAHLAVYRQVAKSRRRN